MTFADQLNEVMRTLGCPAKELAQAAGLNPSVISRYRSGEHVPEADSDAFARLLAGVAQLAQERGEPGLAQALQEGLLAALPHSDLDVPSAAARLETLARPLRVTNRDLSAAAHFDASTVSRILSGERAPRNPEGFFRAAAGRVADRAAENLPLLAELTDLPLSALEDPDSRREAVYQWVAAQRLPAQESPVRGFLRNLDDFDLNEYIQVIHFDQLKAPSAPFQLPARRRATGLKDMMAAELDFLKATALSRSKEPALIYSDMPMEKMAQDPEFPKKWMFGMAVLLRKGLRLNLIHNVDRPLREMMLGLESYIPMYMTGQISPYYLDEPPSKIFHHLLEVSGAAALEGAAIVGHHEEGEYYLTNNREEVRRYQKRAAALLDKAKPLMEIYLADRERDLLDFLRREAPKPGDLRMIFPSLPLFALDDPSLGQLLAENRVPAKDRERIRSFAQFQRELLAALPDGGQVTLEVPALTREEFAAAPLALPLSELFYEREVLYPWPLYQARLAQLRAGDLGPLTGKARVLADRQAAFRNVQIVCRRGQWALVSKAKSPAIHFVLRHPKLVSAIERFTPAVVE